jgi:hypothetical protein
MFRPSERLTLHVFINTYRNYLLVTFLFYLQRSSFTCNIPLRNVPSHAFLVEWIHNKFPSYSLIDAYLVTNSSL